MPHKPDLGLVILIVILTAVFAVFITVVDGLRHLMWRADFFNRRPRHWPHFARQRRGKWSVGVR